MNKNEDNVVKFNKKEDKVTAEIENLISEAVEDCYSKINIENKKAILVVTFDRDDNPDLLYAGAIDPFKIMGVLTYANIQFSDMAAEDAVAFGSEE